MDILFHSIYVYLSKNKNVRNFSKSIGPGDVLDTNSEKILNSGLKSIEKYQV